MVNFKSNAKGYIFIDVLIAIFLFSLGFVGLYSLTEDALQNTHSAKNLSKATALAQAKLEMAGNAFKRELLFEGNVSPGESTIGEEDSMTWSLDSEWTEIPNLLKVKVGVNWNENRKSILYETESLFYVP